MAILYSTRLKSVSFLLLLFYAFLVGGCGQPVAEVSQGDIPAELTRVQQLLDDHKPAKAVKLSTKWLKENTVSDYIELGLKLQADAFYDNKQFFKSYQSYEKVLNEYGATTYFKYAINREIDIAQRFLAGQKRNFWTIFWVTARLEALKILDDIDARWPGSPAAARAVMTRADYYYDKAKYFEAEQEYHRVVVSYARSSHYTRAMYQEAQSKFKQYAGIYYDSICLDEALVLYSQFKLRFPDEAARLDIDSIISYINEEKIKKEYEIADFYYRTGKTQQAVIYWNNVIEMAPQSDYAQRALDNIQKAGAAS